MTTPDHVRWVDETKCVTSSHRRELNAVKQTGLPSGASSVRSLIPSDPLKFQAVWLVVNHSRANIYHVDMIYTKHSSISEWVMGGGITVSV